MATLYPAQIDSLTTLPSVVNNLTPVNANSINILRDAILAIEEELGVVPAGIYTTVSARLDAIESGAGSSFIPGGDLSGAKFKSSMSWSVSSLGIVTAMGAMSQPVAVGTNSGSVPSGWASTIQLSGSQIQVIATGDASLVVDHTALVQVIYSS